MANEVRPFAFEALPPVIRVKIYSLLLISYVECSSELQELDPAHERDGLELHSAILCVSKAIHDEAAPILYGSNVFTWSIYGFETQQLFHCLSSPKTRIARGYIRMITNVILNITIRGHEDEPSYRVMHDACEIVKKNVHNAAKKLSLCDNLKVL